MVFDDEVGIGEIAHFGILWKAFADVLRQRFREAYEFPHLVDMQRDYTMDEQIIIFNPPDAYVRNEISNAIVRLEQLLLQVGPNGITNKWFLQSIYWLFLVFPDNNDNDEPVVTAQEKQIIRTALLQGTVTTKDKCLITAPWVIYLKELRGNFAKSRVTFDVSKWQILLGCFSIIDAYRNRWLRALFGYMILFDGGVYNHQKCKLIMLLVGLTPSDEDEDEDDEDDDAEQEDAKMDDVDDITDANTWPIFIRHLFRQCYNLDSVPMERRKPAQSNIDTENPVARISVAAANSMSRVAQSILPYIQGTIG